MLNCSVAGANFSILMNTLQGIRYSEVFLGWRWVWRQWGFTE